MKLPAFSVVLLLVFLPLAGVGTCSAASYTFRVPAPGLIVTPNAPPALPTLSVLAATYGANCGAPTNNMLAKAQSLCNGKSSCSFTPLGLISDPAVGCSKTASVAYACTSGSKPAINLAAEAGYTTISLSCP
jgi:hypothetical protein